MSSPGWFRSHYDPRHHPGWVPAGGLECVSATLGEVAFRTGPDSPVDPRSNISISTLKGWWEPAPDGTEVIRHPSGDGAIRLNRRLGVRTVELRGLIKAYDMADMLKWKSRIAALNLPVFRVTEPHGFYTEADVQVSVRPPEDISPTMARYIMELVADDPLRYSGSQVLTNGSNALVNRGDVDAFPVIDLRGPHGALTVTHPGGSFSFPALSGGSRSIDCRNGDVWNGNVRVFAGSGAWPVVRSGGSNWTVSGLGTGSATVRRFEAWS